MLHDMINSVTYEKSASWLVGSCIIYSILLSNNINFISYIACNLLSLKTKYFINSYNYHPVLQFVRFGNWIKGSTYLLSNNFIANMMKMKKRHLVQYKNIKKPTKLWVDSSLYHLTVESFPPYCMNWFKHMLLNKCQED